MSIEHERRNDSTGHPNTTQEADAMGQENRSTTKTTEPKRGSKPRGGRGRLRRMRESFDKLLNENVHRRCKKDKHSHLGKKTQHNRRVTANAMFHRLHELGFQLESVWHLKLKHEIALKKDLLTGPNKVQASTYQSYVSVMHQVAIWVNKPQLFADPATHVPEGIDIGRSFVADETRFAEGVGKIDLQKMVEQARNLDERFACLLNLMICFGMRSQEAMKFHPHTALQNGEITLEYGTKGGRNRTLHERVEKGRRAALEWAQRLVPTQYESMMPTQYNQKTFNNHFRSLCRKFGLTKKGRWGFTPHALRQKKLVEIYFAVAGGLPPVAGGKAGDVTRERDIAARKVVAEYAGHGRIEIASAYIGAVVTKPEKSARP